VVILVVVVLVIVERLCGNSGSGSEAGSYLRLIDSCITQITAQGPSRTCNESKEEEDHLCMKGYG